MSDEEELAMPALWSALDEGEILGIHQRLLSSIPPPERLESDLSPPSQRAA